MNITTHANFLCLCLLSGFRVSVQGQTPGRLRETYFCFYFCFFFLSFGFMSFEALLLAVYSYKIIKSSGLTDAFII